MVKLTISFIVKKLCKSSGQSEENEKKNLKKLTHLHLQDSFIDSIGGTCIPPFDPPLVEPNDGGDAFVFEKGEITKCKNLTVVYLQNNAITKIENLDHAVHLTHLYLQKNKIKKIENLSTLKKLRKLYLSHNCISVIEGLDQLCSLEELQIQKQELPPGESLYFDPRSINGLGRSLHTLNTSNNQLTSLVDLEGLLELESLSAGNNNLADINEVVAVVSKWQYLSKLELKGNPICSEKKYREKIIASTSSLDLLDGKTINETTRRFLKCFEKCKMELQNKPQRTITLPPELTDLTKNFNPGVRKSIIESVMQENEALMSSDNEERHCPNSMFPAWKSDFEPITPVNPKIPRPFWRQMHTTSLKKKEKQQQEIQSFLMQDGRTSTTLSTVQIKQ